ncbi:hypothetical protein T492DRAFT_836009 [Pavlovales sp. CCMP2436]|nr:hypothetical protein T492DRAFT_836009 [Pavlovales sp. CCMP2436]
MTVRPRLGSVPGDASDASTVCKACSEFKTANEMNHRRRRTGEITVTDELACARLVIASRTTHRSALSKPSICSTYAISEELDSLDSSQCANPRSTRPYHPEVQWHITRSSKTCMSCTGRMCRTSSRTRNEARSRNSTPRVSFADSLRNALEKRVAKVSDELNTQTLGRYYKRSGASDVIRSSFLLTQEIRRIRSNPPEITMKTITGGYTTITIKWEPSQETTARMHEFMENDIYLIGGSTDPEDYQHLECGGPCLGLHPQEYFRKSRGSGDQWVDQGRSSQIAGFSDPSDLVGHHVEAPAGNPGHQGG